MKRMNKIESFTVDHTRLKRGIYVSRKDYLNEAVLTTFDIRMTLPNIEPAMEASAVHAIEHLGATYLRNHDEYKDKTIYFGPMGCRTGFYVIFKGDLQPRDVVEIIQEVFMFVKNYEGVIPGADAYSCGNYLDLNLPMAKYWASKYYVEVLLHLTEGNLVYPKD